MSLAKESGLYLSVGLDDSPFQKDMKAFMLTAQRAGDIASKAFDGAFTPNKISSSFTNLAKSINTASAAASHLNTSIKVSGLDALAKSAGLSASGLDKMYEAAIKVARDSSLERAFANIQKQTGMSTAEMARFRRELGDTQGALKAAMGALNTRSRSAIVFEMKDIVASYREVKNSADATANDVKRAAESMRGSLKRLASEARATKIAPTVELTPLQQAFASVQRATNLSTQEIDRLSAKASQFAGKRDMEQALARIGKETGMSAAEMAKLQLKIGDTGGAFKTLRAAALPVVGTITAVAAAAIYAGKACFDASLQMDRLQKSYRTVMGSDIGATTQLDYIYGLTQKLGLQFQSTAESAKGFFAASVGTSLENDMNEIFKGVTSAGTALSMTQEQMSGVFLAFSQIASKGKLSMEEVNQIAERLPGTFELVSKAMGVNRQEMFKMIEQGKVMSDDLLPKLGVVLQETFGDKAVKAADGAQGAVNRLSTEWELFKSSASQTESVVQGINLVTEALKEAKNVLNKNNIIKEMSSKGYKTGQTLTQSYWNGPYTEQEIEAVQKYGEAVINANRQIDLVLAARLQKQREYEAEHQSNVKRALKIEQDGMNAWKDATKDLPTFKLIAIDKAEKEALEKLDEWHTRGTLSDKEYQEKKLQIETGYAEKRKSIMDKGAKSAEDAANRAAKALAAYDEEIAKLMQSSRELEQVKIEEKLAKIAKDAKLPTAEMEKLRKAMEQEADFKWMQDILSYADPAAAAVAKVDKEYEAFLRNVEYLKKTDPAKYTQLMTKAETEHEKALRKAERASKEQNEHLQEKLSFYKELEEMSGAFGLSLEVQNRLLDEQMEIFRDADIPENLIQTWRQYKDLMNSHDWADGAQRAFLQYRADATDAAKGAEEAFSSLYSGMDSGWKSAWEQMIETGKVSLSSFKSLFASFLADLMHMAITRPITVQIAGVVSGMLGTGGVAYAAGGSGSNGGGTGGLLGNIPFSSILPDSWTSGATGLFSGITGGINSFASNLTGGFFASSATEAQFNALANSITGGWG